MTEPLNILSRGLIKIEGADASVALNQAMTAWESASSLHMPDMLTIWIADPDLQYLDSSQLKIGNAIELLISVGGSVAPSTPVFKGEIVEVEAIFAESAPPMVVVRAFDKLHRLSHSTKSRTFLNVNDGDIVSTIARENGLQVQSDSQLTTVVHDYMLQCEESDLNFLRRRASAVGALLYVDDQKLYFTSPPALTSSEVNLDYGKNIIHLQTRLSGTHLTNQVGVRSWDIKTKREIVGQASSAQNMATTQTISGVSWGTVKVNHYNLGLNSQTEANRYAQSLLNQANSQNALIDVIAMGDPTIKAGKVVKLTNTGTRFTGSYLATAVTHRFDSIEGYRTQVVASGYNSNTVISNFLPSYEDVVISGVMIGVVSNNQDPMNLGRVKVKLPWLSTTTNPIESNWARVATPGAGAARGLFFLPEVNDEVLIAFAQGNPNQPYVLGGLWNGVDKPPASGWVSGGNVNLRVIHTRVGHKITLDDTSGSEKMTIEDKAGNLISISSSDNSITLKSDGDISLTSQKKVIINGAQGIELKTDQQVMVNGSSGVDIKSSAAVKVEGTGQLELKSSGITTIKGSMINLN